MRRERWVIKTNCGRYVSIPYIMGGGFRSYLDSSPEWNKTITFDSEYEANGYLFKYLSSTSNYYVDRYTFKEGEKLDGVEKVML